MASIPPGLQRPFPAADVRSPLETPTLPHARVREPRPQARIPVRTSFGRGGRLVVVSNRVADMSAGHQSGGLAVAVGEALQGAGGLWCGWSGKLSPDAVWTQPRLRQSGRIGIATVDLTAEEHARYYVGFSNGCLWPAFHQRLDLATIQPGDERQYFAVNERIAGGIAPLLQPGDRVWIHDYHLIPLGQALRRRYVRQAIGFFLHTPFPIPEVFCAVPGHQELARALFAYDVVGFQTRRDRENFARYVEEVLGGQRLGGNRLSAFGQIVRVHALPIGIDAAAFAEIAALNGDAPEIAGLLRWLNGRRLVAGVDRLDYTKGLAERVRGFEALLAADPRLRRRISLLQVAPPTRQGVPPYDQVCSAYERLVGHVNGRYGDLDWTPIQYIHRPMPRALLAGVLRVARVGLVTPLQDGMNLVAKEYVAAQDPEDPGVLVLSSFAGAAEQLTDALIVNPHDPEDVADAIRRALRMPRGERRERHQALWRSVSGQDVAWWRERFLSALEDASSARLAATAPMAAAAMAG
jgi:trehalose 6-phosphate synthase